MTTIVTRAGKGSPLTNNEVDSNFTNLNDAKIETLTSTDTSVTITGTGSSRDLSVPVNPNVVSGPASATDNAVARFDTTTGKLIQNSVVTIDDAGSIENAIIDSFTNTVGADHVHYKIKANETIVKGNILKYVGWNTGENAIEVVKVSSATDVAIGMAHDNLATGEFGLAVVVGTTEGFDTSAFTAGTILYPNTSGGLTATKPTSGTYQACAFVIRSQSVNGAYLVNFSNPVYVEASTNTANTAVIRDGSGNFSAGTITATLNGNATTATTLQTARTIQGVSFNGSANITVATAGTGISVSGTTITNTAPDQTVALTAGTGISTSGTYPNFTITNIAPDQTVALTAGTGISTSGTYPNFTITNTAPSSGGTVTSVATGTGLTGGPITSTGTISLANTAVTPGSYTYSSITVDAQGRVTSASNGAAPSAFPSGTLMLFQQTSAPTGWTKQTTHDNKALRVVSGTAGSGGTTAFTSVFANQTVSTSISVSVSGTTGATTLSTAQMPSHNHTLPMLWWGSGSGNNNGYVGGADSTNSYTNVVGSTGGNGSHTHSFSGSGSGSGTSSAVTLNVQYVDLIIASKN